MPLAFVPMLLGLAPHVPDGVISLNPLLPPGMRVLDVRGIPFPSGRLSVALDEGGTRVIEAPPGLAIQFQARERQG